ncbi:hypothetical protein HBH99_129780 [Parastagonospora nodorum]|nr:hypothetical protein HBH99_129780 [Parastagonospora nodorum]
MNVYELYLRSLAASDEFMLPVSWGALSARRCLGLLDAACSRHAALQCRRARPGYRSCSDVGGLHGPVFATLRNANIDTHLDVHHNAPMLHENSEWCNR